MWRSLLTSVNEQCVVGGGLTDAHGRSVRDTSVGDVHSRASSTRAARAAGRRGRARTRASASTAAVAMAMVVTLAKLAHTVRAMGADALEELLSTSPVAGNDLLALAADDAGEEWDSGDRHDVSVCMWWGRRKSGVF